jgi:hypothetical protein
MGVTLAFVGARASAGPAHRAPDRIVIVRSGDTLWGIARALVGPHGDPRPMVQALIQRNRLGDGLITVGERIDVPSR